MGRLFLIAIFSLLLAGCPKSESPVKKEPLRIASLSGAATALLKKLGTPPVAVDQYSLLAADAGTPVIGKGAAVSPERLLALKVNTLVIWSYQKNLLEHLSKYGIRLVEVPPLRAGNFSGFVKKMGTLTGKEKEAEKIIAEHEAAFKSMKTQEKKYTRVYFELYTRNRGAGDESYIGDMLRAAGGKSILKKSALTGTEYIIAQNPQVIFFAEGMGSREEIMNRNGFAALEAVKHKKVFAVPRQLLVEGNFPLEAAAFFRKRMD